MPPFQHDDLMSSPSVQDRTMRTVLAAIAIMGAVVIYWLVAGWLMPARKLPKPEDHSCVGRPLPFLELRPLTGDGPPTALRDIQNHVTLLNFWGAWCRPCREELPHIAGLRQRYAGQEAFRLLAVSCPQGEQGDDVQSLQQETTLLLKQLKLDLPTYYDPDRASQYGLFNLLKHEAFPTTVLLDHRGVIRAVWVGYRPGVETEMERYIDNLLDEDSKPPEEQRGGAAKAGGK
jgi:thiol-disulfide isomerase/thioredoxin